MGELDIETFHRDLKAALMAEIPLVGDGSLLTVTRLNDLQTQLSTIASQVSSKDALRTSIENSESLPGWYRASLIVFQETGTMLPVLEGLSVRANSIREITKTMRWACIYLLFLVASVLIGFWVFYSGGASAFEMFQEDLRLETNASAENLIGIRSWLPGLMLVFAVVFVVGLIGFFSGGPRKIGMLLGGRKYVESTLSAAILKISQSLVSVGFKVPDAMRLGFLVVEADLKLRTNIESFTRNVEDDATITSLADFQGLLSTRRLLRLKYGTSAILVTVIGSCFVLIYCLVVFVPIFSIYQALPNSGV